MQEVLQAKLYTSTTMGYVNIIILRWQDKDLIW